MTMHQTGRAHVPQPPPSLADSPGPTPPSGVVPAPPAARSAAASRRINKRGAAVSVLVVLLGGVIAFSAAKMLTKHTAVLAVTHAVTAGSTITEDDLTTAEITTDPHLSPVRVADRSQIVGKIAQVNLDPGELLTRNQVGTSDGFTAGQMLVALPLKDGQFPARGLSPGDKVQVVATPGANANQDGSNKPTGSPTPATAATVADVGQRNADSQITVVDVRVSADDGIGLAQLASTGNAVVILLPPGR